MTQDWIYRRPPRIVRKANPNWRQFYKTTVAAVGLATSAESAFSIGLEGGFPKPGLAIETSEALSIALITKGQDVGLALSTEEALQAVPAGLGAPVDQVQENDSAFDLVVDKGYDVGLNLETDTSQVTPAVRELDANKVIMTNEALSIIVGISPIMDLALETDIAQALVSDKEVPLAIVLEVDTAFGLSEGTTYFVGQPAELDTAFSVTPTLAGQLGLADEFNSTTAIVPDKAYAVGLTSDSSTSFDVTVDTILVPVDLGWEDDDVTWGGVELSSLDFAPVYLDGVDFKILGYDNTQPLDTFLERKAVVHEEGRAILGTSVWPDIIGPQGASIQILLGSHETPEGAIDWEGPYDFVIGGDDYVDFAITGRYLAIRFESSGIPSWTLQSYDIEYEIVGRH